MRREPREQRRPVARESGLHHELVLIDQSQLRQRQWELHAYHKQSLTPRTSSAFQSTRSRVLDTTYFFAASIVRAKGSIQGCIHSGLAPVRAGARHAASIIS